MRRFFASGWRRLISGSSGKHLPALESMRLLFTTEFYYPFAGGIQEQARQIMERLAARGHQVTLATSFIPERTFRERNGVRIEQFDVRGNEVHGLAGNVQQFRDFLVHSSFDAMVNFAAHCWPSDLAIQVLPAIKGIKVLSTPGFSTLHRTNYQRYFQGLPARLRHYNAFVVTSASYQDAQWLVERGFSDQVVVIPNGASREEFLAPPRASFRERFGIRTPHLCITVANHYFKKGHLFVLKSFRLMNRQDTTLVIIGGLPRGRSRLNSCFPLCRVLSQITPNAHLISGEDRDNVLAAYHEADAFLFGSRIECAPLVMYESFASKTPFLTTEVGNVKDHDGYLKIVRSPEEMARVANKLLDHPEEGEAMAEHAFALWLERHTWDRIADQYEDLLKKFVGY